jgi:TIR domain-containing protein
MVSDIFISHKSSDQERIRTLVKALEQKAWSVWWDRTIAPQRTFNEVIEEALNAAKCVKVV